MDYLKRNIWVVVLAGLVISYFYPSQGSSLSPFLQPLLMVLTFISTINIKLESVIFDLKRPTKTFISLAIIHLIGPFLVYFARDYFSPDIYLGLILATAVPSGISVIFLTKMLGGDPTRSLVITTISNFIAPFIVPILVLLFAGRNIEMNVVEVSWTIAKLVILPFIAARFAARTQFKKTIQAYGSYISMGILLIFIIGIVSPVIGTVRANIAISVLITAFIAGINVLSFVLGYIMGSPGEARISYGVSSFYKNYILASVLALSFFNPTVAIPAVIFAVVNNVFLIPIQWIVGKESN